MTPELKLKIAGLLPEEIKLFGKRATWMHDYTGKFIEDGAREVRESEWLYILHLIEQKEHPNNQVKYVLEIEQSIRREENKHFGDKPETKFPLNEFGRFAVISATAEQRATAMCKVKGL